MEGTGLSKFENWNQKEDQSILGFNTTVDAAPCPSFKNHGDQQLPFDESSSFCLQGVLLSEHMLQGVKNVDPFFHGVHWCLQHWDKVHNAVELISPC